MRFLLLGGHASIQSPLKHGKSGNCPTTGVGQPWLRTKKVNSIPAVQSHSLAYPITDAEEEGEGEEEEEEEHDIAAAEPEVKKSKKDFTSVYNTFVATYKDMTPQSKFTFSRSHRVLEDVIYDNARTLSKKCLVHQWVLDFGDRDVLSWFTGPGELDELLDRLIPLPESDKVFVASMARFADVCASI